MARDPNKAEKSRESIMNSAIHEFARVGFHQTKISDIVANAGFSQRTFYIYFKNKEILYMEILENWKNKLIQQFIIEKKNLNDQTNICRRWEGIFKFMAYNPDYTRAVYLMNPYIEEIRKDIINSLIQIMTQEQENGYLRREVSIGILAESTLATMESLTLRFVLNGKESPIFLAEQISDIYQNGVTQKNSNNF
ncbi:TetR/AcrR family transcriptional regulator [Mesobacillus zeae]|uniref:TetR/AcrR family transcriptional regulator n=1 Tax=Mesobacillus zeae TaxID=1917180 RepID=A0A398B235_9BACI|nr:TetR/AcrR family transcriptional regulator [Mesobacillus zeae]RID82010.1 TetR/AcrR family transcriptional regulator [Mesobacillus zeae]